MKKQMPGLSERFLDLRDDFRHTNDRKIFFQNFASSFGIGHLAYFKFPSHPGGPQKHELITTYKSEWQNHYFSYEYEKIDPVLSQTMNKVVPLDWQTIPDNDRVIRDFFGDAGEYGIKKLGLSVPLRGPHGDMALLSITAENSKREWEAFKRHAMSDVLYFAYLIHAEIANASPPITEDETKLSTREKEVLAWSAGGKTSWEIAQILGLSERTVDFHLRNAIVKMRASNKTQAVSKAIIRGDLTLPFGIYGDILCSHQVKYRP